MFAKKLFYASAALFLLAAAYHLGATSAAAQAPGNPVGRFQLFHGSYEEINLQKNTSTTHQAIMRIDTATGAAEAYVWIDGKTGEITRRWVPAESQASVKR